MKLLGKIGFWLSEMAEQKTREGRYLLASRLYYLATGAVRHDVGLIKKLKERLEEE